MNDATKYYLWLLGVFGTANPKIHTVLNYYGDAEKACAAISNGHTEFLGDAEKFALRSASLPRIEKFILDCEKKNIGIVNLDETLYPTLLKNIFNPPVILFYRGNIDGLDDEMTITAVGTRKPTEYSKKLSHRICSDLAALGFVIVSGMALGLDSVAHLSAVENQARTIGVLACGVDYDYPKGSALLRRRILESGGAYISEIFPSQTGGKGYFQQRNRILSGLSLGTMVLEASMTSGSLITASYAISQSRDLFCIPPSDVFNPAYAGVVPLLRDGAVPLFNHYDVINQYYWKFAEKLSKLKTDEKVRIKPENSFVFDKSKPESALTSKKGSSAPKTKAKNVAEPVRQAESEQPVKDYSGLDENQLKVVNLLRGGNKNIDEINDGTGLGYAALSEILIELEMNGILGYMAGAVYGLT